MRRLTPEQRNAGGRSRYVCLPPYPVRSYTSSQATAARLALQ